MKGSKNKYTKLDSPIGDLVISFPDWTKKDVFGIINSTDGGGGGVRGGR